MAHEESLDWQAQQIAASKEALKHNLRAAGERALELGRPLSEDEFSAYQLDVQTFGTPIKRLVYVGGRLSAI